MKKILLSFALLSFFLFIVPTYTVARSQNANPSPLGITNNLEAKEKVANKREEIRLRLSATRRERIRSYFSRAVVRIEALIERLEILISRLEARVEAVSTTDPEFDLKTANTEIAKAKTLIAEAKDNLQTAKTELENTLSSDDPKDSFKGVVSTMQELKTNLKEVHDILVKIIGDLKGLRVGDSENEE